MADVKRPLCYGSPFELHCPGNGFLLGSREGWPSLAAVPQFYYPTLRRDGAAALCFEPYHGPTDGETLNDTDSLGSSSSNSSGADDGFLVVSPPAARAVTYGAMVLLKSCEMQSPECYLAASGNPLMPHVSYAAGTADPWKERLLIWLVVPPPGQVADRLEAAAAALPAAFTAHPSYFGTSSALAPSSSSPASALGSASRQLSLAASVEPTLQPAPFLSVSEPPDDFTLVDNARLPSELVLPSFSRLDSVPLSDSPPSYPLPESKERGERNAEEKKRQGRSSTAVSDNTVNLGDAFLLRNLSTGQFLCCASDASSSVGAALSPSRLVPSSLTSAASALLASATSGAVTSTSLAEMTAGATKVVTRAVSTATALAIGGNGSGSGPMAGGAGELTGPVAPTASNIVYLATTADRSRALVFVSKPPLPHISAAQKAAAEKRLRQAESVVRDLSTQQREQQRLLEEHQKRLAQLAAEEATLKERAAKAEQHASTVEQRAAALAAEREAIERSFQTASRQLDSLAAESKELRDALAKAQEDMKAAEAARQEAEAAAAAAAQQRGRPAEDDGGGDHTCIICLERPRNFVLLPCGHAQFCEECGRDLPVCAYCQEAVTARYRIFI